jgi:hypothetical protein
VTRGIALLISSALTVFVLIVGAGVVWHLQAAGSDAGAANTTDLAAAGAIAPPAADRSVQESGRRPDERERARESHTASSVRPLPRRAEAATDSEGHAAASERERPPRAQGLRAAGGRDGSIAPARADQHGARGDRDG